MTAVREIRPVKSLDFFCPGVPQPQGSARAPSSLAPALDLLAALRTGRQGTDEVLIAFIHPGEPVSKSRARFTRGGRVYTPKRTAASEQSLADAFTQSLRGRTLGGNVAIVAVFYRVTHQRIDADNLMKLVMDAGTRAHAWKDDSQVTAQAAVIELDAENPRTLIAFSTTESTMVRGPRVVERECPRCGKTFSHDWQRRRTYCRPGCSRPRTMARCARCEAEFWRRRAGQRYCSTKCSSAEPRVRQPAASSRPYAACADCGGRVSRREYIRCSNCSPKGRRIGSRNRPEEATT